MASGGDRSKCLPKLRFSWFGFDRKTQKYYHARLMSAPAVIDSLEFARAEQSVSGSLSVAIFQRLDDVLFDSDGEVEYAIRGGRDEHNRPQLELRITGELHLQCQRCLGPLGYLVDVANTLLLVPSGARADVDLEDPDAPDAIEASTELHVAALIEDEVLLSLPLAPRHAEGSCAGRIGTQGNDEGRKHSAFAELGALKRPHNKH
jgi:uncharacterized protein